MAKLFIRGVGEVEVKNDCAISLKDQWYQGFLKGKKIDLGDIMFSGDDIKAIKLDSELRPDDQPEYNVAVDGPEKDKVKSFEVRFEDWKARHPQYTEWQEYHFLEELGLIKMGNTRPEDTIIDIGDNNKKYFEYKKLFASLQTLKYYREKAQANNDPDFDRKRIAMFQAMKQGIRTGVFAKADPIAQEAKAFDEKYGIDEFKDIDPSLIPF